MYNLYYSAYFKIMFGNEISEPEFYAKNVSIVSVCTGIWDIYINYIMASEEQIEVWGVNFIHIWLLVIMTVCNQCVL